MKRYQYCTIMWALFTIMLKLTPSTATLDIFMIWMISMGYAVAAIALIIWEK